MSLPSFNPEKTAKRRLWLLGWYMYKNFTKNLEEKKTTKATFKPINCKSSSYLSADCSLPNKLVVWSILGVLIAGLAPKIPEGRRIICECFLSSSAGLWCPVRGLMWVAAAAPTDWALFGVLLALWCPRSILSDLACLLGAGFWPSLFSFPYNTSNTNIQNHFKNKY